MKAEIIFGLRDAVIFEGYGLQGGSILNDTNLLEALGFIGFKQGFSSPHHIISLRPLGATLPTALPSSLPMDHCYGETPAYWFSYSFSYHPLDIFF